MLRYFLLLVALLIVLLNWSPLRTQNLPVSVVAPAGGAVVNDLRRVSGKFERGSGASAVVRIEVLWKRAADGAIWNGSSWGGTVNWQAAAVAVSASSWSFSNGPPQSTLSEGGEYVVAVRAVPSAGKPRETSVSVRADVTGPSLAIATFPAGDTVFSLRSVGGTAYDKSEVRAVRLGIRRERDARFWNGTGWVDGVQSSAAQIIGAGQSIKWQSNGPDATQLAWGDYTLLAFAEDSLGNRSRTFVTVKVPVVISPPANRVVCDGNSLTMGIGAAAGKDYPTRLQAMLGASREVINLGINGQKTSDLLADFDTQVAPLLNAKAIYIPWEISNEIFYGATVDSAFQNYVRLCRRARARGAKVLAVTVAARIGPTTPPAIETNRQLVNAQVRRDWTQFADGLIDLAADSVMDESADCANLAFYTDSTHFTATGYEIIAAHVFIAVLKISPTIAPN